MSTSPTLSFVVLQQKNQRPLVSGFIPLGFKFRRILPETSIAMTISILRRFTILTSTVLGLRHCYNEEHMPKLEA
jgi:hypothetical protein